MNIVEYQYATAQTAIYPSEKALEYLALGLVSEAGEVAGKVKKYIRDNSSNTVLKEDMKKELGDIMWYISEMSTLFGLRLPDILEANINKLADRKTRNVLGGSGDER